MEFSIDNNINDGAVIKVIGVGGGGGNAVDDYILRIAAIDAALRHCSQTPS